MKAYLKELIKHYVDDFPMMYRSERIATARRQLQMAFNKFSKWSLSTGFQFYMNKTAVMHICRVRNCNKMPADLYLNNILIKKVDEYKFLGMHRDGSLTWSKHIKTIKQACTRKLNAMKCLAGQKWGSDRKMLLRLYQAMIKPKLDYGCEAYGSACMTLLRTLEPVQNSALRMALGAYKTSSITSLHFEAGIKPLEYSRDIKILNYYLRIKANTDSTVLETLSKISINKYRRNEKLPRPYIIRANNIKEKYNLNIEDVAKEGQNGVAPWKTSNINNCTELYQYKKTNPGDAAALKMVFLEHAQMHRYSDKYFTDGSKTEGGVGLAVLHGEEVVQRRVQSYATVHTAETQAILLAVEDSQQSLRNFITIVSDSRSAIASIMKYNNGHPIVAKILEIVQGNNKQYNLCWVPSHMGVAGNERVDTEARAAIELPNITEMEMPRGDYKALVRKEIGRKWQENWRAQRQNKLRHIKETTREWATSKQSNREWEVKLARLRIGHCRFTHEWLLKGYHKPYCQECIVPLTVNHILTECISFRNERRAIFNRETVTRRF